LCYGRRVRSIPSSSLEAKSKLRPVPALVADMTEAGASMGSGSLLQAFSLWAGVSGCIQNSREHGPCAVVEQMFRLNRAVKQIEHLICLQRGDTVGHGPNLGGNIQRVDISAALFFTESLNHGYQYVETSVFCLGLKAPLGAIPPVFPH